MNKQELSEKIDETKIRINEVDILLAERIIGKERYEAIKEKKELTNKLMVLKAEWRRKRDSWTDLELKGSKRSVSDILEEILSELKKVREHLEGNEEC